ncbi:TrmH family RNA methyltransferase [Mesohalobacter halotolerans]|jgi:TrmH family RNA methyltransferase|uniref:RNA methyltransferase n=1 Tax=Mesohalobacter halotolerans TaxID=1883405 RepID=A0A4U5TUE1_9FLAO|nr:RNA methyltransferase [Mesohalobacter halotolerans]MBS3738940.1 RNA methyltransferase [Psychroflexus sp.]TKS57124.1 RNA methyltransferase [Mesohalobacter halotolerans]
MHITSTKNPQIKHLKQLQSKSKLRVDENSFVIEGVREIEMALTHHYHIVKVFIAEDFYQADLKFEEHTQVIRISSNVYQHLAYRSSTEGIVALCKSPKHNLSHFKTHAENPLVLVLESPEKPGNIGAILRTVDAAKLDAVMIADPKTDLYNPNTIRASLGAVFSNSIVLGSSDEIYEFLNDNSFNMYSATLQNSNSYLSENYKTKTAFIMGSEAYGLTTFWRQKPNIQAINIPMKGQIDSMNLSVSSAILIFEALRQRESIV